MNHKILVSFILLQCISIFCLAHEFWMMPTKFNYRIGETVEIECLVGENFIGNRWTFKPNRIQRLDHVSVNGSKKLPIPSDSVKQPAISFKLESAGTHIVVLQSTNAYIELEGDKFNDYLKEDGLEDALVHRQKSNTLNNKGKEHYQRNCKLLLTCASTHDDTFSKPVGLPLEIIPINNPFTTQAGGELTFRILFEGKPHAFSLVKVWNQQNGRTFIQNIYSDKEGIISTRLNGKGSWMISAVKMIPSKDISADWQSYWSSLVFGF